MSTKPLKVIAGAPDQPLKIGDIEISCYVLEDETRVLSQQGVLRAIGRAESVRGAADSHDDGDKLPYFLGAKNINPFINKDLVTATNPIRFLAPSSGPIVFGYAATLLPHICEVYLAAREAGVLRASQIHIAERAEILLRGFAHVGIIALVDEATGYQEIRARTALATILEKFIAKELHPWTKTFPYSFYEEICRLKGWPGWYAVRRPHVIAEYTNDFVYYRIAPGVLREVQKLNPINPKTGERMVKHHQWFTEDHGHPRLREHIASVTALMRASANWSRFKTNLARAFPAKYDNMQFPFMDEE